MRQKLTFLTLICACTALVLNTSGCQRASTEKKFKIGFSQCCNDAWRDVMNGEIYRELSLHPELELEMQIANNDSEEQVAQIRKLVAAGIDILLVSPNEAQPLTSVLEEVYKSGIPVILIDRKIESALYTAYIGADNYDVGATAGKYIISQFPRGGKIIEIQLGLTISPARERSKGFRDAIKESDAVEIVGVLEAAEGLAAIDENFPTLLEVHPEANIIFGHTDHYTEHAYRIVKEQQRADTTFFIGIDGIPGTGRGIQAVEDGILNASVLYPTGGTQAIRLALAILGDLPFDKENSLETIVINDGNASILHNQMKKVSSLQKSIDQQLDGLNALELIYRNQRIYIIILLSSLLLTVLLGAFLWRSLRAKQTAFRSLEAKNREILDNERQLRKISSELKEATRAKVDFFTNISHEFRTPLTLILGFAEELLPNKNLSADTLLSIQHIQQNAYRLLRLVNQLMDFRKMESYQMKVRASEQDLVGFVRNLLASYHKIAQKRQINFGLLTRQEEIKCWFDVSMMDKVLFNLLSNAFKFTPDHGEIQITISVDKFEQQVILSVEDSGPGMSEEEIRHIFEPFYQGEEHRLPGTGLGLSLSKSLIELQGGTIEVQSTKGQGSRFLITLALGKNHLHPEQIQTEAPSYLSEAEILQYTEATTIDDGLIAGNANEQNPRILCIEDNHDLQFFLKNKLSKLYQIQQATDGQEGLQIALEQTPDLIICDITLPGRNGLQITKNLKSDLRTSHIPIILLSSRSTIEQQIAGMETGADAYLTKPFNIGLLQAQIKSLLLNRQVLQANEGKRLTHHSLAALNIQLADNTSAIDRNFIQHFTDYIQENYTRQDFQVADLCEEMGLSRSQLYRKIKSLLGESVSSYIEKVRLQSAEQLLRESQKSVTEIAYQIGYSSPDYFSTVFKSKYNITPSQFRNRSHPEF